jgi:uncharacterized protein YndB with AHSA1/START domain
MQPTRREVVMEYGTIEREIHVDAAPELVFEVVSRPEHIREWWDAETDIEPAPGVTGELVWSDDTNDRGHVSPITVVDAQPPRLFSFRWVYPDDAAAASDNSLLVTFTLSPSERGTTVRMIEGGFREMGWEAAVLEAAYHEHVEGWDFFIPRLGAYADRLVSSR